MPQVLCPIVVGRAEELSEIQHALMLASDGKGSVLIISGEAGIGKSRLCREAEKGAADLGMARAQGRAIQAGEHLPYRPVVEVLHSLLRDSGVPADIELGPFQAALGGLLPEFATATPVVAESSETVLVEGLIRLIRALAKDDALLLVLEDLHWADEGTLSFVRYLCDHVDSGRVLVLCTRRAGWPGPGDEILTAMVTARSASEITLARLSGTDVEEMARSALQAEAVPASVLAALEKRAEGVPFLVEEMLSAYVEAGGSPEKTPDWWVSRRIADALPPSYGDLVRDRLSALGEDGRRVVTAAAVLGRTFDWTLLGRTAGLPAAEVLDALRSAMRVQLVAPGGGTHHNAYFFRHALVRETILAELLPSERAELSLLAADAIEDSKPGLTGEWLERAADLREQGGDSEGAVRLLQESARRAINRFALGTAEATLMRAKELAAGDYMTWIGVHELLFEALSKAGKTSGLVELSDKLRDFYEREIPIAGNMSFAMHMLRSRVASLHLRVANAALLEGDLSLAEKELSEASEKSRKEMTVEILARADALSARIALASGNPEHAVLKAQGALKVAEQIGIPEVVCESLDALGSARLAIGEIEESRSAYVRLEKFASNGELMLWRIKALLGLGILDQQTSGDTSRLRDTRSVAESSGAVSTLAMIDLQIAWNELDLGLLSNARPVLDRVLDSCRMFGLRVLPHALVAESCYWALLDEPSQMEPVIKEALEIGGLDLEVASGVVGNGRTVLWLVRDKRDAALGDLRDAIITTRAPSIRPAWWMGLFALLATSQDVDAKPAREWLRESPAVSYPVNKAYLGYADAIAFGRQGDPNQAARVFDVSDSLMPAGWKRHHARRLVAESAIESGWGNPALWATEALEFFEGTNLPLLGAAARSFARRVGIRVPRRGRGASEVPPTLQTLGVTSREMDVLNLVGEGLSNQEIAERLFVSPRTIETHVSNLMRKTVTETRPHLVALGARHRPNPIYDAKSG